MVPAITTTESPIDATRLGEILGRKVSAVTVESATPTILSHIWRLRLTSENAPARLILKTAPVGRPAGPWKSGRHEVAFYRDIAAASPAGIVPRCFDCAWDDTTEAWHLLLEDLSQTHVLSQPWPLPPTLPECEAILQTCARFHAAWWDDSRLGVSIGAWGPTGQDEQSARDFATQFGKFCDAVGDRLSRERRALYERFIERLPQLTARYHSHRNMTVVHGDTHVWNFFLPKGGGPDVRLFDWDAWRPDVATDDLAYTMALHWYPDLRRLRESHLLDVYHRELQVRGVSGYDRRTLGDDYRLSVLGLITKPVWQQGFGLPPVTWWHHLDRIHFAVDDLGCRELLD